MKNVLPKQRSRLSNPTFDDTVYRKKQKKICTRAVTCTCMATFRFDFLLPSLIVNIKLIRSLHIYNSSDCWEKSSTTQVLVDLIHHPLSA